MNSTTIQVDSWESPRHDGGRTPHKVDVVIDTDTASGAPTICLESPDYCSMWDDLTADQARSLGEFLDLALRDAAHRVVKMTEARA